MALELFCGQSYQTVLMEEMTGQASYSKQFSIISQPLLHTSPTKLILSNILSGTFHGENNVLSTAFFSLGWTAGIRGHH